ncbi:hypothetical protein CLOM_g3958 [Closterium sp. NIES-68]|nr:hypothetical protein CLOM_g3958 [Closterium sp. NIES-68]
MGKSSIRIPPRPTGGFESGGAGGAGGGGGGGGAGRSPCFSPKPPLAATTAGGGSSAGNSAGSGTTASSASRTGASGAGVSAVATSSGRGSRGRGLEVDGSGHGERAKGGEGSEGSGGRGGGREGGGEAGRGGEREGGRGGEREGGRGGEREGGRGGGRGGASGGAEGKGQGEYGAERWKGDRREVGRAGEGPRPLVRSTSMEPPVQQRRTGSEQKAAQDLRMWIERAHNPQVDKWISQVEANCTPPRNAAHKKTRSEVPAFLPPLTSSPGGTGSLRRMQSSPPISPGTSPHNSPGNSPDSKKHSRVASSRNHRGGGGERHRWANRRGDYNEGEDADLRFVDQPRSKSDGSSSMRAAREAERMRDMDRNSGGRGWAAEDNYAYD